MTEEHICYSSRGLAGRRQHARAGDKAVGSAHFDAGIWSLFIAMAFLQSAY